MSTIWSDTILLIRGDSIQPDSATRLSMRSLLILMVFCGSIYGISMGSYAAAGNVRVIQCLYSGLKVPLLLIVTFCLSLPSFFIINTLLGLRDDFKLVARALLSSQAGQMALLASLSPYVLLWNNSSNSYDSTILFNGVLFGVSTIGGNLMLSRSYRKLIEKDSKHRIMLRIWFVTYAFVGIQLGWNLRPFIGRPGLGTTFFRADILTNAYEAVFEIVRRAVFKQ